MANYLLKASAAQMERWKVAAEAAGLSLAEWLRDAADGHAGAALLAPKKKGKGGARSGLCEHRVPPTSHCSRCD